MTISKTTAAHKISRARHIVSIWSPWWYAYLNRCEYLYVYDNSLSIVGSSSLVMTISIEFVESHNVMEVAVYIEFALQQMLRTMDSRAERFIEDHPDVRQDIIGLSQALEINQDIAEKFSSISASQWNRLVSRQLDREYLQAYDVSTPPALPEGFYTPEMFGFPLGLAAEKYAQLLIELNNDQEEEFFNPPEESKGDTENAPGEEDTSGGDGNPHLQPQGGDSGGDSSTSGGDSGVHNDDVDSTASTDFQPVSGDSSGDSGDSHSDADRNDNTHTEKTEGTEKTDKDNSSGQQEQPQSNSGDSHRQGNNSTHPDSAPGSGNSSGDYREDGDLSQLESDILDDYEQAHDDFDYERTQDQRPACEERDTKEDGVPPLENPRGDHNQPDPHLAPQPSDNPAGDATKDASAIEAGLADDMDTSVSATQEDVQDLHSNYQHLMDRVQDATTGEGHFNFDVPRFPSHPIAPGTSTEEKKEIDQELASAIQEYSNSIPDDGFSTGASFIKWSGEKLRKPVVPWQKVLRKIVTLSVSRAQMSGTADLSYAKQNPNQQPDMPIMMGFVTYPPEVSVLVDASPSMVDNKFKTISEFSGVVQKILLQYSQPVVMAAADSGVQYVSYSTSPAHNIIKNIGKTFDGTSAGFGETLQKIARKGVYFRGRRYPAPDILIVFTDCLFRWPLPHVSKLPISYATVIVASTQPYDKVKDYLPRWVREKKNFVYISD